MKKQFEWFHDNIAEIISLHPLSKKRVVMVFTLDGMYFRIKGNSMSDVLSKSLIAVNEYTFERFRGC